MLSRSLLPLLLVLAAGAVQDSCTFHIGNQTFDTTRWRNVTYLGHDLTYPGGSYFVSVCGNLPKPCIDSLTGVQVESHHWAMVDVASTDTRQRFQAFRAQSEVILLGCHREVL